MKILAVFLVTALAVVATLVGDSGTWAGFMDGVLIAPFAAAAEIDDLAKHVRAELARISQDVNKAVGGRAEVDARVAAVEQLIAKLDSQGFGAGVASGPSIGREALRAFESDANFNNLARWNKGDAKIDLTMSIRAALTNEGINPSSDQTSIPSNPERGDFVREVLPRLRLLQALPIRTTSRDSVEFVQISTAAGSGEPGEQEKEGDLKPEGEIDGTLRRAEIVTIAWWVRASKQVLEDHSALQRQIDVLMRTKIQRRLEHQIINGVGGAGRIEGLLAQAVEHVPNFAAVDEQHADFLGQAIADMETSGYNPDLVVMSPTDWTAIQLSKDADFRYLHASPLTPAAPGIWGRPIVTPDTMPVGTALILDRAYIDVLDRQAASVMLSNSDGDNFRKNLVTILAELRAGLEIRDPFAVLKVDLPDLDSNT